MAGKVAVSYARTSRERDDAFSIASQHVGNREYARQHGFILPPEYELSEEFTGKAIDRPELNRLRQMVRSGTVQAVLVYVTDRFARRIGVGEFLLDELLEYGVELHIVSWGAAVRDTPEDRTRYNFEMLFSDFERRKILERTARGRMQKLTGSDGVPPAWLGQGPITRYGYEKVGKKRQTRLRIIPEQAEIIRLIFHLFVHEGKGANEIVKHLNGLGTPTRSQATGFRRMLSSSWGRGEVYKVLRDEAYAGTFWAYRFKHIQTPDGKSKTRQRPREEWVKLEFPELRIVDEETFRQAQQQLAEGRKRYARKPEHPYLMARRITCECGYAVGVRTEVRSPSKHSYYFCGSKQARYRNGRTCWMPTVRGDLLEGRVWERLETFLRDPNEQQQALREAQAAVLDKHGEALAFMRQAEEVKSTYEQSLQRYYDDYLEGLITKRIYLDKKAELDKRLAAAEEVLQQYQAQLQFRFITDEEIEAVTHGLGLLQAELERLGTLDFYRKRELVEAMNVTGEMRLEDGWQVLYLSIHEAHIGRVFLQEMGDEPVSGGQREPRRPGGPSRVGSDLSTIV